MNLRRTIVTSVLQGVTVPLLLAGLVLVDALIALGGDLKLTIAFITVSLAVTAGWIAARSSHTALRGENSPISLVTAISPKATPRDVSQRLVASQEAVRREMADYLHGHVQSKLLALSMSLRMCQQTLDQDPEGVCRMLENIQRELKIVQDEDVRQVSHGLYPSIVKMGLAPALRSLVSRYNNVTEIDLSIDPRLADLDLAGEAMLPEKVRLGVYRIAEEAVSNVMKHAGASRLQVRLAYRVSGVSEVSDAVPDQLVLSVSDNGNGFDTTKLAAGQGLASIVDYAEAIGGKARVTSVGERGYGVNVSLVLPIPAQTVSPPPVPVGMAR